MVILRSEKGAPLTHAEMDANFLELRNAVIGGTRAAPRYLWTGVPTTSGVTVTAHLNRGASSMRLAASTSPSFTNIIYSSPGLPDQFFMAKMSLTGLAADTQYYYALEIEDVLDLTKIGKFKTLPTASSFSKRVLITSCDNHFSDSAFTTVLNLAKKPEMVFHLGDIHYGDTGAQAVGGNPTETDYQNDFDTVFDFPNREQFYREFPTAYIWDDHDFAGNDETGRDENNNVINWTATALTALRRRNPAIPVSNIPTEPFYYTVIIGRIRFIMTDLRSWRTATSATDNASKTMFGANQKAWFKQEITNAKNAGQCVAWCSSVPWSGTYVTGQDHWSAYSTERTEIADYVKAQAMTAKFIVFSGDMHQTGVTAPDDFSTTGTGAGFVNISVGPISGFPTTQKGDYAQLYPANGANLQYQLYGLLDIVDDGTYLRVEYASWSASGFQHTNYLWQPFGAPTITGSNTFEATGGTITQPGDGYKYWRFNTSADLVVTTPGLVEYVVVGGGGPGGATTGTVGYCGGGAGGAVQTGSIGLPAGTHRVVVGKGGTAGNTVDNSVNGGDSSISSFVFACGGGKGGSHSSGPFIGGSGGGGGGASTNFRAGATSLTQGFAGGSGIQNASPAGGGGGGANGAGGNAAIGEGGVGGVGRTIAWAGTFGGGGGGSGITTQGAGGAGGGGAAYKGTTRPGAGIDGQANTGGGGGGAGVSAGAVGGHGGTGVVIIRRPL